MSKVIVNPTEKQLATRRHNQTAKQRKHDWYVANREHSQEYQRQYYADPQRHDRLLKKSTEASNAPGARTRNRDNRYVARYGITRAQVDQMITDRNGLCDICGLPAKPGKRLHVDHDHELEKTTGEIKVRGMLCFSCNISIGYMQHSPERLRMAADYLERVPVST